MSTSKDLVFWQNTLSAHQAPLLRALSDHFNKRVLLVASRGPSDDRAGFGWDELNYGSTEVVVGPSADELTTIINGTRDAVAHIFSGLGAYPPIDSARRAVRKASNAHVAVVTESWDPRGLAGYGRRLRYRHRIRRELDTFDSLITIGDLAETQFKGLGVSEGRILPFAYAVSGYRRSKVGDLNANIQVVFVGALTKLKNPSLLIRVLHRLRQDPWKLTIVGDGPLRERLEFQVGRLDLSDRVAFMGSMSAVHTRAIIASSDLLVLTSQYDGWGAVVTEALMSGTPALVSDRAGANQIIVSPLLGSVFSPDHEDSLYDELKERLRKPIDSTSRNQIRDWSESRISAFALAKHLLRRFQITEGFIAPPWTSNAS